MSNSNSIPKALTECEPEMQAYFPEKLNWRKNNQSEYQTQEWQHFSSRLPHFQRQKSSVSSRVSVQGVKSLGGHFACLCRGFEFYEVKNLFFVIIFQKENEITFTLFIIFIVKSLQKEQNITNLLLWPLICRNKPAITPKWFNYLDTNSKVYRHILK